MAEQVISLTSSDEEENSEPPPKKMKTTPIIIPQVTLTLVKSPKKKEKPIETVTLDSDDDLEESTGSREKISSENTNNQKNTVNNSANLELITLTDDEEDIQVQTSEVNAMIQSILGTDLAKSVTLIKKSNSAKSSNKVEIVSLTDSDSDSDMEITEEILVEEIQGKTSEKKQDETTEQLQGKSVERNREKLIDELQGKSTENISDKIQQTPLERVQEKSLAETEQQKLAEDIQEKSAEDIQEKSTESIKDKTIEKIQEGSTSGIQEKLTKEVQEQSTKDVQQKSAGEIKDDLVQDTPKISNNVLHKTSSEKLQEKLFQEIQEEADDEKQQQLGAEVQEGTVADKEEELPVEVQVHSAEKICDGLLNINEDIADTNENVHERNNEVMVIDEEVTREKGTEVAEENERNVKTTNDSTEIMVIDEDFEETSTTVQVAKEDKKDINEDSIDKVCEENVSSSNENIEVLVIDEVEEISTDVQGVEKCNTDITDNSIDGLCKNSVKENSEIMVIDEDDETSTVIQIVEKGTEEVNEQSIDKVCEKTIDNRTKNNEIVVIDVELAEEKATTPSQIREKCNEEGAENGTNKIYKNGSINTNKTIETTVINEDISEQTSIEKREKNNGEIVEDDANKEKNIKDTNENMDIMVIDEVVEETSIREKSNTEIAGIDSNIVYEKTVNNANDLAIMTTNENAKKTVTLTHMTEKENKESANKIHEETEIVVLDEEVVKSTIADINMSETGEKDGFDKQCKKNVGDNVSNTDENRDKESPGDSKVVNDCLTNVYVSLEKIKCDSLTRDHKSDSIVIDDSDEDTEKENHCEKVESFPVAVEETCASDIPGPSELSKNESAEARVVFRKFLKMVELKIVGSSFEEILPKKVPIIEKYFKRCGSYVTEMAFEKLLRDSTETVSRAPNSNAANTAVLAFHRIFENLKSRVAESTIEIEEEHLPKVKKLEKTMKLLRKRIRQLEEAEVNFDDDEDSAYIMLDRYQARLNKVYAKYCQYIGRNPYSGRPTYDKISFVHSKYNEINQAISRKYKNSINFPSYYELEKYIAKISKREKLDLSDQEIKHESKKCFKHLGSILQKKRRQELYDSHLDFIEFTEDPAVKDISLENILRKNYSEGKDKIEKIYERYVNKQEQGEDHISSDDAGTSEGSDSEENKSSGKSNKKLKTKGKKNDKNAVKKSKKENEESKHSSTSSEAGSNLDKDKVINEQSNESESKANETKEEKIMNGHNDKVLNENIEET